MWCIWNSTDIRRYAIHSSNYFFVGRFAGCMKTTQNPNNTVFEWHLFWFETDQSAELNCILYADNAKIIETDHIIHTNTPITMERWTRCNKRYLSIRIGAENGQQKNNEIQFDVSYPIVESLWGKKMISTQNYSTIRYLIRVHRTDCTPFFFFIVTVLFSFNSLYALCWAGQCD